MSLETLPDDTRLLDPMTIRDARDVIYRGQKVYVQEHLCWFGWSRELDAHVLIPLLEME